MTSYASSSIDGPLGIAVGPDNALWFANSLGNSIGRITTAGSISSWTGSGVTRPSDLVAGPDYALWFTNQAGASIGHITG